MLDGSVVRSRPPGRGRTAVRCRRCGERNVAIDIWCTRCGSHLDWEGETIPIGPDRRWQVSFRWTAAMAGAAVRRRLQVVIGAARTALSRLASEARARIKRPSAPRPATGRPRLPVPRPPALSASARALLAAGAVVMVALAAVVLSATAARTSNGSHPAASRTSAAAVTLDAGPNASAGHLWWHLQGLGWMAQDFLLR